MPRAGEDQQGSIRYALADSCSVKSSAGHDGAFADANRRRALHDVW
ncbi:hypothetical protein [Rhodococcus sp. IEGM 1379]|nr:hypothetical protein [Rhodococcus sp. IEGM 1379]MDI9915457.1 hypothetical protein [Rhodococcus sp. IEGM 1379]